MYVGGVSGMYAVCLFYGKVAIEGICARKISAFSCFFPARVKSKE